MEEKATDSNPIYDCIVIGAGISGISFAHYLHRIGKSVLILEKEDKIGGQIQTYSSDNYWRELGAHTCYNSYTNLLSILDEINGEREIQVLGKYGYKVYTSGKIKGICSPMSFLQLFLNGPKVFFASKENKTVKEYFRPIVGKSNYDKLFSKLFKAVICQNADNYPAELFLKKRKERRKDIPRKFTFKKGLLSFLDLIVEKDQLNIKKSVEVTRADVQDSEIKVETKQGKIYYAKNIALAVEPKSSAKILNNMQESLRDLLNSIPLFHSESINITIKKDKTTIDKVAGIIPQDGQFLSVVSRDLLEHPDLRSFTFHFEKNEMNENQQIDVICSLLGISKDDIIESKKTSHALPSLNTSHLHLDDQIRKKQNSNIYILGNYFYGLSLEDCVNRSIDEFERFKQNN